MPTLTPTFHSFEYWKCENGDMVEALKFYPCARCKGTGLLDCGECGNEKDCDECDDGQIDARVATDRERTQGLFVMYEEQRKKDLERWESYQKFMALLSA